MTSIDAQIEVWSDDNMVNQGEGLVFAERPSLNPRWMRITGASMNNSELAL